jgi:hypothetical protein
LSSSFLGSPVPAEYIKASRRIPSGSPTSAAARINATARAGFGRIGLPDCNIEERDTCASGYPVTTALSRISQRRIIEASSIVYMRRV